MDGVARIIDQLYDGITDAAAWSAALGSICGTLEGHHAVAMAPAGDAGRAPFVAASGVDPVHLGRFVEASAGVSMIAAGQRAGVVFDQEAIGPLAERLRSDFYNDVIRPMQGYWSLMSVPFQRGRQESFFAVCRPSRAARFDARTAKLAQAIVPHLGRALRLGTEVVSIQQRADRALAAFDGLDLAVIIVDRGLNVVDASPRAAAMLRAGDGLRLTQGRLATGCAAEQGAFDATVARALADDRRAPGRYAVSVTRPEGRPAWCAILRPLDQAGAARMVAISIETRDAEAVDLVPALVGAFQLTRREAAVVAALASGQSLAAAAAELGITPGSARIYLKSAFAKTDTHRQAELVGLVLRRFRAGA